MESFCHRLCFVSSNDLKIHLVLLASGALNPSPYPKRIEGMVVAVFTANSKGSGNEYITHAGYWATCSSNDMGIFISLLQIGRLRL